MTSPTPSLPASIREALDEYRLACRIAVPISYGLNAFQADAERDEDAARTALEAHLLALVADAARIDWLEDVLRPLPWGGVYATLEADDTDTMRITVQPSSGDSPFINELHPTLRACIDAARTPPEDTTPHE